MLKTNFVEITESISHYSVKEKVSKGGELFIQRWDPDEETKAVILLVHGFGEHSTRYDEWARKFVSAGFGVVSFDLRGHGKSSGKRGYIKRYDLFLKDIEFIQKKLADYYADVPVFLYGHSFGGNLVANYAISNVCNFNGLILTSPWFKLTDQPSRLKESIAKFILKFLPGLQLKSGIKPEHISRDLRVVHNYKSDPLIHDKIAVKTGYEAIQRGLLASKSIYRINVPLLIMHGNDDQVTDYQLSRDFIQNASAKSTYVEWEGGYHELHNDLDSENVFNTILDWLNKQL